VSVKRLLWLSYCLCIVILVLLLRLFGAKLTVIDNTVEWLGLNPGRLCLASIFQRSFSVTFQDLRTIFRHLTPVTNSRSEVTPESAIYAACVKLECMPWELDRYPAATALLATHHDIFDQYVQLLKTVNKWCPISTVAYAQGYHPTSYALRAFAISMGKRVVAVENTSNSTRFLWDDVSGITVNHNSARNMFWRHQHHTTLDVVNEYCDNMVTSFRKVKTADHLSGSERAPTDSPFVLVIGQVYSDAAVLFGSRESWSYLDMIQAVLTHSRPLNQRVLLKLHPKEFTGCDPINNTPYQQLTYRKLTDTKALDANHTAIVDTQNKYDTYDLIRRCSCLVTLTSQTGLEAATLGIPVIVCGRAFYSAMGFTLSCDRPEDMAHALSQSCHMAPQERKEIEQRARKFSYIYFNRYCKSKSHSAFLDLLRPRS